MATSTQNKPFMEYPIMLGILGIIFIFISLFFPSDYYTHLKIINPLHEQRKSIYISMYIIKCFWIMFIFLMFLYSGKQVLYKLMELKDENKIQNNKGSLFLKKRKKWAIGLGIFILLYYFFAPEVISYFSLNFSKNVYVITNLICVSLIIGFMNIMKQDFASFFYANPNIKERDFSQNEEPIIENPFVCIPYQYKYGGGMKKGYANFYPYFGTLVFGLPGSGKTYIFVYDYIFQMTNWGASQIIYDFKNELSTVHCNYLKYLGNDRIKKIYGHIPKQIFINPSRIIRSHAINPFSPDILLDVSDCINASNSLMKNLSLSSGSKGDGSFWEKNGEALFASVIIALRYNTLEDKFLLGCTRGKEDIESLVYQGNCCSIPHAVELLTNPNIGDRLWEFLKLTKEATNISTTFRELSEKEVHQTLGGILANARSPIAALTSPNFYYIFSEQYAKKENTSKFLYANEKGNQAHIYLINDSTKPELYSIGLTSVMNSCLKACNVKDKAPSHFCMDEASTFVVNGINLAIATGRSNKLAINLILQDKAQFTQAYGKELGEVITNICKNVITGQLSDSGTARWISENIGKHEIYNANISKSNGGYDENSADKENVSYSLVEKDKVPIYKIQNLSVSWFAGKTSDTIEHPNENQKGFFGKFIVDTFKDLRKPQEDVPYISDLFMKLNENNLYFSLIDKDKFKCTQNEEQEQNMQIFLEANKSNVAREIEGLMDQIVGEKQEEQQEEER